ncbi:MAG: hypothetical protein AB7O26_08665 [Planctomycetaceae bacterium]
MNANESWRPIFENWPQSLPKEGLIVTTFQEQIPFNNFLISGGVLLVERDKPDSFGARKVMISYDAISAVKFTNVLELARYQALGFQPPF